MAFESSADKIEEANHFLLLMRVAELPSEGDAVPARLQGSAAFRFAFSAFVASTRALLHFIPEEGTAVPGFTRWYVTARERWLRGDLARFFANRREFRLLFPEGMMAIDSGPGNIVPACVTPPGGSELRQVD